MLKELFKLVVLVICALVFVITQNSYLKLDFMGQLFEALLAGSQLGPLTCSYSGFDTS